MSRSDARKEHGSGSARRHSPATMAGGMSGCPRELRAGTAAFGNLAGALCCDLLPPSTQPACPDLPRWLALGCGTQQGRSERVSLGTRPSPPATLHGLGSWGGWALAPRAAAPRRRALGTRRGRVGVRPRGRSHVWHRVGGCGAPVVRPPGPGRPLSRRPLLGLRGGRGPSPGRPAPGWAPRLDHGPGPPRHSWRAQRPPRVARAAPVGVGQVADPWPAAAAWGERGRGRDGAAVWVAALAGWLGRAL
jgi:hypothetical protein